MDYVKRHTTLAYDARADGAEHLARLHFAAANAHRVAHEGPGMLLRAATATELAFGAQQRHDVQMRARAVEEGATELHSVQSGSEQEIQGNST